METQRQWSDWAVFRTSPLLFGLSSLITVYAHENAERLALSPRRALWYPKPAATFSDALARLRRLWFDPVALSLGTGDMPYVPLPFLQRIIEAACSLSRTRAVMIKVLISDTMPGMRKAELTVRVVGPSWQIRQEATSERLLLTVDQGVTARNGGCSAQIDGKQLSRPWARKCGSSPALIRDRTRPGSQLSISGEHSRQNMESIMKVKTYNASKPFSWTPGCRWSLAHISCSDYSSMMAEQMSQHCGIQEEPVSNCSNCSE